MTLIKPLTDDEILYKLCTIWRYDEPTVQAFRNLCVILDKVECAFCQLRGLKELDELPGSMRILLDRRTKLRAALAVVNGTDARHYEDVAGLTTNFPSEAALP